LCFRYVDVVQNRGKVWIGKAARSVLPILPLIHQPTNWVNAINRQPSHEYRVADLLEPERYEFMGARGFVNNYCLFTRRDSDLILRMPVAAVLWNVEDNVPRATKCCPPNIKNRIVHLCNSPGGLLRVEPSDATQERRDSIVHVLARVFPSIPN
jgi:hypothetical protein